MINNKSNIFFKGSFEFFLENSFKVFLKTFKFKYFDIIKENCQERVMLEDCFDNPYDQMPTKYINPQNKLLIKAIVLLKGSKIDNCIESLEEAKKNGCGLGCVCEYAIIANNFELVKWVAKNGDIPRTFYRIAAEYGRLEMIKWRINPNMLPLPYVFMFTEAARNGHLNILIWLRENNYRWADGTFWNAVFSENLELLKWLKENGCPWNEETLFRAVSTENIGIITWLIENKCPLDKDCYSMAVKTGNMEILKLLKDKDCPIPTNIEIIRWLIYNGNQLDIKMYENACLYDTEKDHLELLKWLKHDICTCDLKCCPCSFSQYSNKQEILEILFEINSK